MWEIGRHGRVVMGRIVSFDDDADAERYCEEWRRRAAEVDGRFVVCADYRRAPVFSPAAAESIKRLMAQLGERVERSAILIDPAHATHAMQVSRLAREAGHEARRRFAEVETLLGWLDDVCTIDERHAVRSFLGAALR
jgi:hypothetical protein